MKTKKFGMMLVVTFNCLLSFGQTEFGFGDGLIVTKQNDTIWCQVEIAVTYGDKIAFRKNTQAQEQSIQSKDIKSITTPYKYWENIQLGKRERLMSLLVDGEAKLFNHVTINLGASTPSNGGTYTSFEAPTVLYALKMNGVSYEITKKNFREIIGAIFSSCQSVTEKVSRKEYKFRDLEKIVAEYNACN